MLTSRCFIRSLSVSAITGLAFLGAYPGTCAAQDSAESEPAAIAESTLTNESISPDLYQFPPKTPEELIRAAQITQQLDRVGDSRAFLRKLLEMQLSDTDLQFVRDKLGPGPFLDLRRDTRLQPESESLMAKVNAASRARVFSATELTANVERLGTVGSAGERAALEILASGDAAIPALLNADAATPSGRIAQRILETNAASLRHGLLLQLPDADSEQRIRILNLLGTTGDSQLALRLLRWQFQPDSDVTVSHAAHIAISNLSNSRLEVVSSSEAIDLLLAAAEERLRDAGQRFSDLHESPLIREVTGRDHRAESLLAAKTLTADAVAIDESNREAVQMAFIAECAGLSPSLTAEPGIAAQKTTSELLSALSDAIELHPAAAIECLRALRSLPMDQTLLYDQSAQADTGRVLRMALRSPDARVRSLTAALVREKMPVEVSAVSMRQTIEAARTGSLKPEVVVVSSDDTQLRSLEVTFEDAGFTPAIAETGAEGFELAASQLNCELFVLQAEAPHWPIATTLANLRADVRTRNTPIVVVGDVRFAQRVTALAKSYEGVWFVSEPAGTESLLMKLNQQNVPTAVLSAEDRAAIKALAR